MEIRKVGDEKSSRIAIDRPVFGQKEFEQKFFVGPRRGKNKNDDERSCGKYLKKSFTREKFGNFILGLLPVIEHWRTYEWKKCLIYDVIAGFSTGVIHLPQGLGFALLAGVPPVFGLYTSFLPGWIYYIFGTSRHLSYGTMAVLALMTGSFVNKQDYDVISAGNETMATNNTIWSASDYVWNTSDFLVSEMPPEFHHHPTTSDNSNDFLRVNAAALLMLTVGLLQIFMSSLRLGVVSTFMSMPFVKSFTAGAAVHIAVNQIPFQLGFKVKRVSGAFQLPINSYNIGTFIPQTNMAALATSIVCMVFLILTKEVFNRKMAKRLKFPVPAELIVVIVATVVSHFAEFDSRFQMKIIGSIPNGFPKPFLPSIYLLMPEDSSFLGTLATLLSEALQISIIGFALAITMAKLMAERHNYDVDSNHELLTSGLVNGISSFFGCISSTQAAPRTLVLESCGCKSQLAGFISTLLPFIVVVLAGSLFAALPICVLGSVVSAAMLPLIVLEFIDFIPLWSISKGDGLVWLLCFATTVFVDIGAGLLVGILVSGFAILFGNKGAKGRLLKRAGSTEIYVSRHDIRSFAGANNEEENISKCLFTTSSITNNNEKIKEEITCDVAIFRFECSLYFVNAESFKNTLFDCVLKKDTEKIVESKIKSKWSNKCCHNGNNEVKENVALKSISKSGGDSLHLSDKQNEAKVSVERSVKHVILDFSRISDIDVTGLNALKSSITKLEDHKVSLSICCCPDKTRKRLEAAGLICGTPGVQWAKAVPLYPSIMDAHAFSTGLVTL